MFMLVAATGFGAMVEKDMMGLRLQGSMDFDNPEGDVETDVSIGLGYFIADDIELGGLIGFENSGSDVGFGLGAYSEMLFDLNYLAAPFVGAATQLRFGDFYAHDHVLFEINGGIKVFLTEYVAVSGMLFFDLATADVYADNDDYDNYDAGLRVGLNVYF